MTQPESPSSLTIVETPKSLPEIAFGTSMKLQKIDPVTGKHLEQAAPLEGTLYAFGEPKPKVGICNDQKVWIDGGTTRQPDHTSKVQKIEKMSDGSYRIHTLSSVYLLIMRDVPKLETEPDKAVTAPVRRNLRNLFGLLK